MMRSFQTFREEVLGEGSRETARIYQARAEKAGNLFDKLSKHTETLARRMHETSSFAGHAAARAKLRAHLDKLDKAADEFERFGN